MFGLGRDDVQVDLWRVSIATTSEAADTVETLLLDQGALGTEIVDVADIFRQVARGFGELVDPDFLELPSEGALVSVYSPMQAGELEPPVAWMAAVASVLAAVRNSGLRAGSLTVTYEPVLSASYEDAWKAHYHPLDVSTRLVVVPLWERDKFVVTKPRIPLYLDPGMAFGTGTHETTMLCARLLETFVRPDESRVLDVGTGSGILSIAAAKLGAARVVGVDLDEVAVQVARANAQENDLGALLDDGRLQFIASDLLAKVSSQLRFDIVVANLLAGLVIRVAPAARAVLTQGGCLIASGLVSHQAEEVREALIRQGFAHTEQRQLGDWIAMIAFVA